MPAILLACRVGLFVEGCSRPAPIKPASSSIGPHKGAIVELPGGGFVEYVLETEDGRPMSSAKESPNRPRSRLAIVAYFLGPDAKVAMVNPPSGVRLRLPTDSRKTTEVELRPRPEIPTGSGPAAFASAPGEYVPGMLRGMAVVDLGGRTVEVPLVLR